MTEQPPSAIDIVRRIRNKTDYFMYDHEAGALLECIFDEIRTATLTGANALCDQRVSAETERWQHRDHQRLEQISRLQETVQSFQSARAERPAPAAADYTEQAREIVRKYIKLGVKFVVGPNVYAECMKNDIADALSERDAAAIRAFGKGVWSDTEEVAYQAGVSDTREKLREPDEALIAAIQEAGRNLGGPMPASIARAIIARIAEMLT